MNYRLIPHRLSKRALLALVVHAVVFAAIYWFSYNLLYDFQLTTRQLVTMGLTLPAVLIIKVGIFYGTGHCHRSWRYVSFSDLFSLLISSTSCLLVLLALDRLPTTFYIPGKVL